MKKNIFCIIAALVMASLTACGNASGLESNPETEAEFVEYEGEGEVQGGIKSDEEIESLQDEEESYEPEIEYFENEEEEDSANVEMETPEAGSTYISADNFWQGDDYFDLEEFFYQNGAVWVQKGRDASDYSGIIEESEDDITVYKAQFDSWIIRSSNLYGTTVCSINFDGDTVEIGRDCIIIPLCEDNKMVRVNSVGTELPNWAIQAIINMVREMKESPYSDFPFSDGELYHISK